MNAAGGRLARAPAGLKKDPRIGLAKADVLGKHHHREIPVQTCPLELSNLLFAGAIGDDPQGLISQLFQAWSGILEGAGQGLVRANEYLIARIGFGVGEIGTAKNLAHALAALFPNGNFASAEAIEMLVENGFPGLRKMLLRKGNLPGKLLVQDKAGGGRGASVIDQSTVYVEKDHVRTAPRRLGPHF